MNTSEERRLSDAPSAGDDTRGDDTRVDELRQRLRALGYLDVGVDRFVLGPAREARRPATIAALASVRVGLLAGALLGPAAAVGIGARLPALVTGARDALVIALYLSVLFGAASAAVAFLASLAVARLATGVTARRARLLSRSAGLLVGAASLAYLTLWWRIANADTAALAPGWTAFVAAIAVAISLLLGHVTAITAFAVMAAASRGRSAGDDRREPAWPLTAVAAVLAFLGAAGVLLLASPASPSVPPPALTVVSPGIRVKVMAIDGFDPAVMETLTRAGGLQTLSRLFGNGAARLASDAVRDPAREWTTIATGQPPSVHGVHGLETRRVAGLQGTVASGQPQGLAAALRDVTDLLRLTRVSAASGAQLRAKTFWEVAADAGLRAAVVNWWATWPASGDGANPPVVVSDRATLRLERGGALDGEIAPQEVYERLKREWPAIESEAAGTVAAMLPPAPSTDVSDVLRRAAAIDALQVAIATRLDGASLDLLAVYLPGLDIAQHALLGSGDTVSASTLAARLDGVRGYYRFLDGLLRPFAEARAQEMTVVIGGPGRIATITHGVLAVSGAGAAQQPDLQARPIDIAPTLLHILGVPVSRELAGAAMPQVLASELAARFPVRHVDTYGQRTAPSRLREGQPLDREMIERLRSLGYVR